MAGEARIELALCVGNCIFLTFSIFLTLRST
nr:MAG TPA: hypothetical protein [Caudoviricetes sp.]